MWMPFSCQPSRRQLRKQLNDVLSQLFQAESQLALLKTVNERLRTQQSPSNDVLVSIVVTSYNYERFLRETLDSILAQTWTNWEAIVVDDGSEDNSKALILEYVTKDARIRYFEHLGHCNRGLAASLQLGITQARGEYIAFLESDDYWHPIALELQLEKLRAHPEASLCFSSFELVGNPELFPQYRTYRHFVRTTLNASEKPIPIREFLRTNNPIFTFSCVLAQADTLRDCRFDSPFPAYLDWWLWRQIASRHEIIFNDLPLTYWRAHSTSFCLKEGTDKDKLRSFCKEAERHLPKE